MLVNTLCKEVPFCWVSPTMMKLTLLKKVEMLEVNLKTHKNQQQQQNPETLLS